VKKQIQKLGLPQQGSEPFEQPSTVGLLATGSHKNWSISIDDSSRPRKWFAEVRGPSFYLYFEIPSLEVVHEWFQFFDDSARRTKPRDMPGKGADQDGGACEGLEIGTFLGGKIAILRDTEFADRCFFLVGGKNSSFSSCLRITVAGTDLAALRETLRQVDEDLKD